MNKIQGSLGSNWSKGYLGKSFDYTMEEILDIETQKIIKDIELEKLKRFLSISILDYLIDNFKGKKINQYKRVGEGINSFMSDYKQKYELGDFTFSRNERNKNVYQFEFYHSDIDSYDRRLFDYKDLEGMNVFNEDKLNELKKNIGVEVVEVPTYDEVYNDLLKVQKEVEYMTEYLNKNINSKYMENVSIDSNEFMEVISHSYKKKVIKKTNSKHLSFNY